MSRFVVGYDPAIPGGDIACCVVLRRLDDGMVVEERIACGLDANALWVLAEAWDRVFGDSRRYTGP